MFSEQTSFAQPVLSVRGNHAYASYGSDEQGIVEFSMESIYNQEKSAAEGKPIYEDVEYISIQFAGDKTTKHFRPVVKEWKSGIVGQGVPPDTERWKRAYEIFKSGLEAPQSGTPVEHWHLISGPDAKALKHYGIKTVEQLASVHDGNLAWAGARKMRDMAVSWLESTKENAGVSQLAKENAELRNDLEAMKNQLAALSKIAEQKDDDDVKPRGRPKKDD